MIDLNHIFLFVAVVSPLAILARAWRPDSAYRAWRIASLVVLGITGIAWTLFPGQAGYIGGGAWVALLFLPAVGLRRMMDLAARQRYESARKLATALQLLHPGAELRRQIELLRALDARQRAGLPISPEVFPYPARSQRRRLRDAPAVVGIILLNVVAFVIEMINGGWENPLTLHRLGALEPAAVLANGEYWRLLTALFLHYGFVHLLFNAFALYVLGPALERAIGTVRFIACYLISGIGSSAGVVLLWWLELNDADLLVGASGCVMGIVGAWAGFLLRYRHMPEAKRRLTNVLMIIAVQTVFDLTTPQISMSAHWCGLLTGFVVGLVITPRKTAVAA